jgi:mediator of RNA polymerase II transcription subunit 17
LQPIIDLLQYQVFCDRIKVELDKMVSALLKAGIPSLLRFDVVGESGHQLVEHFAAKETARRIGGEALLRIDVRQVANWSTFLNTCLCYLQQANSSLNISFSIISYSPFATSNPPDCVHPSAGTTSFG